MAELGAREGLPERLSESRAKTFPAMVSNGYVVTSCETTSYNCIAYAGNDHTRKWSPDPGYYWPPNASRSVPSAVNGMLLQLEYMFISEGYEVCQRGDLEEGYEKIALYMKNEDWTHAARQLSNGAWSSKLGDWEDVMHSTPHCFGDSTYGDVYRFMRRRKQGVGNDKWATEKETRNEIQAERRSEEPTDQSPSHDA